MTINKHILAFMGVALLATGVQAQNLTKEITVEKDIVPVERDAHRLRVTPSMYLPEVSRKRLSWSDRAVAAPVTASISTLAPAQYMSTVAPSPYRGYVGLGYFPSMQAAFTAGYRFADTDLTRAGAWLQYDGSDYKGTNIAGNKLSYRDHTARLGIDVSNTFKEIGTLDARLNYTFAGYNYPALTDKGVSMTANDVRLALGWRSQVDAFSYSIGLDYNFLKFGKALDAAEKGLGENYLDLDLGLAYSFGSDSRVGADIDFAMVADNGAVAPGLDKNSGLVSVAPYYAVVGDTYRVRLGLRGGAAFKRGGKGFVAPDVKLEWLPSAHFTAFVKCDGGTVLNPMARLWADDHAVAPVLDYFQSLAPTRRKWGVEGGFVVGPFAGASIEAWGGYADMENQLMPTVIGGMPLLAAYNFKSINYGVAFNYNYRDMAVVRVSYEGAPSDIDRGYAAWTDRAKSALKASLTVKPVDALDITLGYTLRGDRTVYSLRPVEAGPFEGGFSPVDLDDVSSLDLGLGYRFSDRFTVWGRGENLLGTKWQSSYLMPCKGLTGLVGITYRF